MWTLGGPCPRRGRRRRPRPIRTLAPMMRCWMRRLPPFMSARSRPGRSAAGRQQIGQHNGHDRAQVTAANVAAGGDIDARASANNCDLDACAGAAAGEAMPVDHAGPPGLTVRQRWAMLSAGWEPAAPCRQPPGSLCQSSGSGDLIF